MGGCLPPPRYFHWVDDNLYADIRKHMLRTIAASIIALYDILGYPSRECPDVVSWDKFSNLFSHTRKATGRQINTQTMMFGLTNTNRNILLSIFQQWLQKSEATYSNLESSSDTSTMQVSAMVGHEPAISPSKTT